MTPKDKAIELVENSKNYVHGYVGSSMLTNYEYPDQILSQAKKVATIICDEVIATHSNIIALGGYSSERTKAYWNEIKEEIAKLQPE